MPTDDIPSESESAPAAPSANPSSSNTDHGATSPTPPGPASSPTAGPSGGGGSASGAPTPTAPISPSTSLGMGGDGNATPNPSGTNGRGGASGNASTGGEHSIDGGAGAPSASGGAGGRGGNGGEGSGRGGSGGEGTGGSEGGSSDALCHLGNASGAPKAPLALSGNTFAHDPTLIKVDQTYYRFWTGERIQRSTSTDLLRWSNTTTVYTTYPSWVDPWLRGVSGQTFNFPWAPDVAEFGGLIHLYSSFSAKFGDNVSCITHLTTDDIAGNRWTDHGPIICTEGNENYNAIDADVGFDTEGNPYFSFGSFWDGIFAFPLNPDGSRKGNDLTRLAWAPEIEAPVFLYRCGYYYLFVTWGLCCPGEGRRVSDLTYRVVVGRSENILGPYVDKAGRPLLEGGGTLVVQGDRVNWAAAGHSDVLIDDDAIYHTYHAYAQSNGNASLRIVELEFDAEGWPLPHAP